VIVRDGFIEAERIKQLPWSRLSRPIIAAPVAIVSAPVNHASRIAATDFCNKIGTLRTFLASATFRPL
jgi:hypothetical protein